ncbi:MAG: hypothetical protein KAT46_06685 [Deltaproteobacteria bacterium]|nr:hypothetical protein [Deltaproteobacteria bacterium]
MRRRVNLIVILFLLITLCGCGLHVSGRDWVASTGIESLAIPVIDNNGDRAHVESFITSAVVSEFSSFIKIADNEDASDAVLLGAINKYELIPVSYDLRDIVLEYQLKVTTSFKLKRTSDGEFIWRSEAIYGTEDFLVDTLSIAITKERERLALEALALEVALTLREQIVGDLIEKAILKKDLKENKETEKDTDKFNE